MSLAPLKTLVILGPTASGKSALAVDLARKLNGEIISTDSRQVYRGLDIGTGKITKREMRGVRHHLLDVASPRHVFTVAQYQKFGARAIRDIMRRGKLPIICGGTGFYIDALVHGYALPAVKANPALRKKLGKLAAPALFEALERLDPQRAATIDRHNKVRLIRAIEIVKTTGKPVPQLQQIKNGNVLKIGIQLPDAELKQRIHARLFARLKRGMTREVERLKKDGLSSARLEALGLEYRYVNRYLEGELSKSQMIEELEREIWRYAKRQMTWFRRDTEIHWVKNEREAERIFKTFL